MTPSASRINEKKVVGYVEYEGQKVYFDKNGIVLECVDEEQETPAEGEPSDGTASDGTSADGSLTSEPLASEAVRPTVRSRQIRLKVHV